MKNNSNLKLLIIVMLILCSFTSAAANRNVTLTTTSATNHIMLWVDDPANIDITQVTFLSPSMTSWVATIAADGNSVDLSGATLSAPDPSTSTTGGSFRLRFSFPPPGSATLSFQWAELNFNGTTNTILNSGSFSHGPGTGLVGSSTFTHLTDIPNVASPVPLGSPLLFMFSAAAILGLLRRSGGAKSSEALAV